VSAHVSNYLTRPLRSEAEARADRARREMQDAIAPLVGLLHGLLFAVAVWLTLALWLYAMVRP
jgi:hypothetical protein